MPLGQSGRQLGAPPHLQVLPAALCARAALDLEVLFWSGADVSAVSSAVLDTAC